jgi:hypothetical protein
MGRRAGRGVLMTGLRDLVELVRLPAALTVPGDALAGAAAAGFSSAPSATACATLVPT